MADTVRTLLATMKKYFENPAFGGKQIDEVFFPELDESTGTTITVDRYLKGPYAARSIVQGQPAKVRQYAAGSGTIYTPELTKEKTPVDEVLSDSVIAGLEATDDAAQHYLRLTRQIVDGPAGFRPAFKMARAKAAIDVYRTGVMSWVDENGTVNQFDFQREAAIGPGVLTYDFTAAPTFDSAVKAMYDALRAQNQGFPGGQIGLMVGSSWLKEFETDSTVIEKRKATNVMQLVDENMLPPSYQGCEDLTVIAKYNVDGMAKPVTIMTYEPGYLYKNGEDGTPEEFMPANAAIMFPMNTRSWRFNRGIQVKGTNDTLMRVAGDLVMDTFVDNDPPIEWFRANARFMYIPGNINHIASAVGSAFN